GCSSSMHSRIDRIEAAPEVLRVQLLIVDLISQRKLSTYVELPKFMDLTPYQSNAQLPLKYRLQAVIAHEGETISYGHYISMVRGPQGVFKSNDNAVIKANEREMLTWPYRWPETDDDEERIFQPYLLTFVKV
ncbi:cysteine proteinase, partial [Melanomma pulvis-pyrius CBS 109.77]